MSLRKSLDVLKAAGFSVPDTNKLRVLGIDPDPGVACVFKCNCGYEYKSPIPLTAYEHGCGKMSKKTWPLP